MPTFHQVLPLMRLHQSNMIIFRDNIKTRFMAGFTLIELLIVVAIIGILAGVGIPMYNGYINSTKESTAQSNLRAIAMMEADYFSDNGSYYKAANTALINTNLFSKTTLDPNSDYNYSIVDHYYGFEAIANPKSGMSVTKWCLDGNNDMNSGSQCP